jgi:hypothetical protein
MTNQKSLDKKKQSIDKEIIFEIDCIKNNHYPTLVFDKKVPSRVEFPNFQWDTNGLKKVTKFRYFMAGIKLWYLQLKDRLFNHPTHH